MAPHPPTGPTTFALLPTPHTQPCAFLPIPSAKSYKSEEITVPPCLRALKQYRSLRGRDGAPGGAGFSSSAAPAPRESAAFAPAVPGLRSCPRQLDPARGLAMRFWRPEFRKVARPQVQRLRAEVRGQLGAALGRCASERAGVYRPAASDSHLPLPSVSQSGPERRVWARKQQTEGEAGGPLRSAAGAVCGSRLRIRAPQGPGSEPA